MSRANIKRGTGAGGTAGAGKRKAPGDKIVPPTPEQMQHAQFVEADIVDRQAGKNLVIGKAFRRRPMVDILAAQSLFSDAEYKALRQYRHFASLADRSLLTDSLAMRRGGSGDREGPTIEILTAIWTTEDIERAAGSLAAILRAVIVYDMSLSQWAIEHGGSVEKTYVRTDRKGRKVEVNEVRAKESALRIARLDIQMAAKRVEAELGA